MTGRWRVEESRGLRVARCLPLLDLPGVAHAFSTRCADGGDRFDLGDADSNDPVVESRRRRLCDASGLAGRTPAILRQVHGARLVRAAETIDATPRADGVIAAAGDPADPVPSVRTADCVPILLAEKTGAAVAAVHGGWRGAAAGIARAAVGILARSGAAPADLVAALGPSIGACCYRVGAEVSRAVAGACGVEEETIGTPQPGERWLLDLHRAHRLQLEAAGIPASSIFAAPWCTVCHPELFFSYRREGAAAGRQMACVGRIRLP